jgi:hypothetical protein
LFTQRLSLLDFVHIVGQAHSVVFKLENDLLAVVGKQLSELLDLLHIESKPEVFEDFKGVIGSQDEEIGVRVPVQSVDLSDVGLLGQ